MNIKFSEHSTNETAGAVLRELDGWFVEVTTRHAARWSGYLDRDLIDDDALCLRSDFGEEGKRLHFDDIDQVVIQ